MIQPLHPREFTVLSHHLPPTLKHVCDLAYGVTSDIQHLRDTLLFNGEIDYVTVSNIKSAVEHIQSIQLAVVNEQGVTITQEQKDKLAEDFRNMFLIGPGKSKTSVDILHNFQKLMASKDYSSMALLLANMEAYLSGYILEPLRTIAIEIERESITKFAEHSIKRVGLVPQYHIKTFPLMKKMQ